MDNLFFSVCLPQSCLRYTVSLQMFSKQKEHKTVFELDLLSCLFVSNLAYVSYNIRYLQNRKHSVKDGQLSVLQLACNINILSQSKAVFKFCRLSCLSVSNFPYACCCCGFTCLYGNIRYFQNRK